MTKFKLNLNINEYKRLKMSRHTCEQPVHEGNILTRALTVFTPHEAAAQVVKTQLVICIFLDGFPVLLCMPIV